MTYTRVLFDQLPEALRTADETGGVISHITRSIQPQLDIVADRIETEEYIYDVDLCPPDMLDWLGQLVGLAPIEGKYLGLGLNPLWPAKRKREVIARAWVYWQISGTNMGVREGLALWLDWPGARDPALLEILMPLDDARSRGFEGWWGWSIPYDWNLTRKFNELKKIGNGNDFDRWSLPLAAYTPLIAGVPTADKAFAGMVPSIGSALGLSRPWMHCYLLLTEWNEVVSNIRELNPEIWAAEVEPVVFAWLDFIEDLVDPLAPLTLRSIGIPETGSTICEPVETGFIAGAVIESAGSTGSFTESASADGNPPASVDYLCREAITLFELRPKLKLATKSKNWRMFVTTAKGTYTVTPVVIFFTNEANQRSVNFDLDNFNRIYLEFLFAPIATDAISRIEIYLGQSRVLLWDFAVPAQIRSSVYSGFKTAFQLGEGVDLPTVGVVLDLPTVGVELTTLPTVSVAHFIPATDGVTYETLEGSPDIPFTIAYFVVSLANDTAARTVPISVSFNIGGDAEYGTDWHMYPAPPDYSNTLLATPYTEVTFLPGQISVDVSINITTDALIEFDESIELTLIPNPSVILDPDNSTSVIVILNDDNQQLNLLSVTAGAAGIESSSRLARTTIVGNQLFANRINIPVVPSKYQHEILPFQNPALEPGEPIAGGSSTSLTMWRHWIAPADMLISMDLYGSGTFSITDGFLDASNIATTLAVYTGNTVSTLTPVATGYDYSSDLQSYLWFEAVGGTNYKIQMGTSGSTSGRIFLNVRTDLTTFTISRDPARTGPLSAPVTVDFSMTGTAIRNRDYVLFNALTKAEITSSSLVISAGSTEIKVIVQLKEDAVLESSESITMTLVPNSLSEINPALEVAEITVTDNSPPISQVDLLSISAADAYAAQGRGRNTGISTPVLVNTNRSFANSYAIPSLPADYSHEIDQSIAANTSLEAGEPTLPGYAIKSTAWWHWTATFTGHVSISTYGSAVPWANYGSPVYVSVYTGSTLTGLTRVSQELINRGTGSDSFFFATVGITYRIQVGTLELTGLGTMQIHIAQDVARLRVQRDATRTAAISQNLVIKSRFSSTLTLDDDYAFLLYNAAGKYYYPGNSYIYNFLCASGATSTEVLVKYTGLEDLTAAKTVTVSLYEDREYEIVSTAAAAIATFAAPGAAPLQTLNISVTPGTTLEGT